MESERRQEYLACLGLRHCPGLGARTWKRILLSYPSVANAVENPQEWVFRKLAGLKQVQAFQVGAWRVGAEQEAAAALEYGMDVLLWSDPAYPELLRHIPDPPLFLYVLGDTGLMAAPGLAVVGSRRCSRYGLDAARTISRDLSRAGVCVVSGFAVGIDRQAHLAALDEAGSSIAVLGTGLDLIYPAVNRDLWVHLRERGLIVTEFPPGTRPEARNFPHRNRIISGLALGVLVIEAALRSGSLITVNAALEQGREVFALPGPVNLETYEGCHHLIKQGASLVQSAEDILRELRPLLAPGVITRAPDRDIGAGSCLPEERWPDLCRDDLRLVGLLQGRDRVHIDSLCAALDQEPEEVSRRLVVLEMRAIVTQMPGMYYQLQ